MMKRLMDVQNGKKTLTVNANNVLYLEPYNGTTKTWIYFAGTDGKIVCLKVTEDYESVKKKLGKATS